MRYSPRWNTKVLVTVSAPSLQVSGTRSSLRPSRLYSACALAKVARWGGYAAAHPTHLATFSSAQAERSEEHTSELQSRLHLVCRLLLEKKKTNGGGHYRALSERQYFVGYHSRPCPRLDPFRRRVRWSSSHRVRYGRGYRRDSAERCSCC